MRNPVGWAPPTTSRNPRPFSLTISTPVGSTYAPYLRRHLRRARPLINSPLRALHVILVGNKKISDLHRQFLGIDGPTDVLTFPIDTDPRDRPLSGEVYVCVPYARLQARQGGVLLRHELLLYALHGMLHLSGYDDRTHRDFNKMHRKEDQVLQEIGIGKVFAPKSARRRRKPGGVR